MADIRRQSPHSSLHPIPILSFPLKGKEPAIEVQPVEASTPEEIANAFAAMARQNAGALIVARDALLQQQKNQIVELAAKQRLPSIGGYGEYVEAGGLLSYGNNIREIPKRAASLSRYARSAQPHGLHHK